ncbi:Toll/interleukin-1 receptor domain-containing protein [Tanacetum coccineum]
MDLSCLSMLKELCLDGNPIVSMPDCVRTLPRLEILDMQNYLVMTWKGLAASSIEIEGMIKIQPIAGVDDTILCSLGWSNLEFLNNRRVGTYHFARGPAGSRTQNEMEDGDQLTISIKHDMIEWEDDDRRIRECGVSFVYDDGKNEKEEDPLSYYKSWNHIIGGDLSPFQLTTQEYNLDNFQFSHHPHPFIACGVLYKDKERLFKAFSQKNSNTRGRAIEIAVLNSDSAQI